MPDLMRIGSLGAGVQSTAVALMATHGLVEPIPVWLFADTGAEPAAVYRHLRWLEAVLAERGVEVRRVSTGSLMADALDASHRFASMPLYVRLAKPRRVGNRWVEVGMMRRQCTKEYKLKPLLEETRRIVGVAPRGRPRGVLVESVQGISWDEAERMRDPYRPWIVNAYPLVDLRMTRWDCLTWLAENGYPKPPRSACTVCPFRKDHEWRWIRDNEPRAWEECIAFDEAIRNGYPTTADRGEMLGRAYLHKSCVPLAEVDLSTAEDRGQGTLFMSCDPYGCNAAPGPDVVLLDPAPA